MIHFQVPAAAEMLFTEAHVCPYFGGLTFDGVAVDQDDRQHLIMQSLDTRMYLGPDHQTVARRALILAAGLQRGPLALEPEQLLMVMVWIADCWASLQTELTDARKAAIA